MVGRNSKLVLLVFVLALFIFVSLNFINAACWQWTDSTNCTGDSEFNCKWKNDSWGGWCEEINCWSYYNQTSCDNANVPGKNCTWTGGGTNSYCEQLNCWSYSGTDGNTCVNNTAGKNCQWNSYCYMDGWDSEIDCWSLTTEANCKNVSVCKWGQCSDLGCWSYSTSDLCNAGKDWRGKNCTWDSSGSYCTERGCWRNQNQTACLADANLDCMWKWDSCQEIMCWNWDGSDGNTCVNNTLNLSCTWDGQWCMEQGCWNHYNQADCGSQSNCLWKSYTSGGWCNEVQCWNWDSWSGGSQTDCVDNSSKYNISCTWEDQTGGTPGVNGWCMQDVSALNCTNITTERACMDTYWCWWQYLDWNNPGQGGNCSEPNWASVTGDKSITIEWNPGCYIFDMNETDCNNTIGCSYNATSILCVPANVNVTVNGTNVNLTIDYMNDNGINCTLINNSQLCNNIPALSSCCSWSSGYCQENKLTTSCWDGMTEKDEDNCEDADTYTRCKEISNYPWYMPCEWSNSSENCLFKADNVFGNTTQSLVKIESKKNCEAAGGKWITESYCEGNISVSTGRCEYKCNSEDDCDKVCFACESYDSNGGNVNASNAESACTGSVLGYCKFSADTNAPNGIGYCKAKSAFVQGVATDCKTDCGACTYMGNSLTNDTTKKPSYHCITSKANSAGGGCKWVTDNSTESGGYCINKGEKICEDACDRCYTKSNCQNLGRTAVSNISGACKWDGSTDDGTCVNNLGNSVEVCWDGVDNTDNGLVDCMDPSCYADSFCGFVEGDCFIYNSSAKCNARNSTCEWITDNWGSWCDFKGASCWKYDINFTTCEGITQVVSEPLNISTLRSDSANSINNLTTLVFNHTGTGWAPGSVNITNESGYLIGQEGNYTVDYAKQIINFSNSSFMVLEGGAGNMTNVTYQYYTTNCKWSNGTGNSWCEQDWSITEVCMGLNQSNCMALNASGCNWTIDTWCSGAGNSTDWCQTSGGGWCDHESFKPKNCWMYQSSSSECGNATGCNWKIDEWSQPHCEVNWSSNCWQNYDTDSCSNAGCYWRTDTWGSWCTSYMDMCWSHSTKTNCESQKGSDSSTAICYWYNSSYGSGWCQPLCFNESYTSSNTCNSLNSVGCYWVEENGWCEEQYVGATCSNTSNFGTQENCEADSNCRWRSSGWCDPKDGGFFSGAMAGGGGVGGAMGSQCYKYDGNKSFCTNKTLINISCGWMDEPKPWCEVDWSTDCWSYLTETTCTDGSCWWNNESNYCTNLMDVCWNNLTLRASQTACNDNLYCNWSSWGSCEPTCFNATTSSACGTGCKWVTGWCNPSGMNDMFKDMQAGSHVPLGTDACGTDNVAQASVDICGFGMKDMGDSFGFGAGVYDFSNASICNKEKLSSFIMSGGAIAGGDIGPGGGAGGGGYSSGASEKIGDGNETIKYFVYLDTDGSTTDGCTLTDNSSAPGYEFKFRYASEWNSSKDKAVETFNSYKCEGSDWVVTDIKLSAWKKKMCNEMGGMMVAVQKSDLVRFPKLYNSSSDIRVYVATADATHNHSAPSDSAGPSWTTPGAIDFSITDMFSYGAAGVAQFEDLLRNCFMIYEDCFNNLDDDFDGTVDCNDWDCQYSSKCNLTGINVAGFVDTSAPQVRGVKIEEYSDAALIMYDTTKPSNGTLLFYYNDSQCLARNTTIYDVGVLSNNSVREFKLWHTANIYNGTNSLNYALANETTYYYKLKVCDSNGKCGQSKCSSFITSSEAKCGYCNFVTRIKTPTGWTVNYDVNQDGIYEHAQGKVCGPSAGMKTNYTEGRKVNIKINNSDESVYFEFINASLTKSALNENVRTITSSGDIINASAYVGFTSTTRDKIINNLHPEACRVKIPFSGTCDKLYHCDDTGTNCTDRTSSATKIDTTNCVWEIPFCEFSTYREALPATTTTTTTSSSSGGGGGGGAGITTNATTSNATEETSETTTGEKESGEPEEKGEGTVEEKISDIVKSKTWLGIIIGVLAVLIVVGIILKKKK